MEFLDDDEEPQVSLLTGESNFKLKHKCCVEEFIFDGEGRVKCTDLISLFDDMKDFEIPTAIQSFTWSSVLYPPFNSLIVQVLNHRQGKYLAYVLPMVVLVDPAIRSPQSVCIVPNQAVGQEVLGLVRILGKNASITSDLVTPSFTAESVVSQVVIGTVDIILQLVGSKKLDASHFNIVVIDQVDLILKNEFRRPRDFMEAVGNNCQVLLFSSSINDTVKEFSEAVKKDRAYNWLFGNHGELAVYSAKHYQINLRSKDKYSFVDSLDYDFDIGRHYPKVTKQVVIFVNPECVDLMCDKIKAYYIGEVANVAVLRRLQQTSVPFEAFKEGYRYILISSERNMDWRVNKSIVNLVINADLPMKDYPSFEPDYKEFFHRISRAGRFGHDGLVLNLIKDEDDEKTMSLIETYFDRKIPELPEDYDFRNLCSKYS